MTPSPSFEGVELKLEEEAASPATTPGSIIDEEKFLVPYPSRPITSTPRWTWRSHLPAAILTASLLEILTFLACDEKAQKRLRFEPTKMLEAWRFLTYMLLHEDCFHLLLNIVMQLLFAYLLELRHGRPRVLALYLAGGVTGVLGASCFHPDLVIGASGGVYALLIAHVADILLNFEAMSHKVYRGLCILVIVVSDMIVYNLIQFFSKDEPLISWGAHVFGGVAGFCLGLAILRCDRNNGGERRKLALFWAGCGLYGLLLISLVALSLQIRRCTPGSLIHSRYIYFC